MALLINDPYGGGQELQNVGQSRITPRETYGTSAEGIRSQYADQLGKSEQLVTALNSLSRSAGIYQRTKQDAIDAEFKLSSDGVKAIQRDAVSGGSENIASRIFNGIFGAPQVSSSVLMQDAHNRGKEFAINALTNDPRFIALRSEDVRDPAEFNRRLSAIVTDVKTKSLTQNQDFTNDPLMRRVFEGGFGDYEKTLKNSSNAIAVEKATDIFRRQAIQDWRASDSADIRRNQIRQTVAQVVKENGGDPVVADQFASIENPSYNPTALGNNGRNNDGTYSTATGIFQINDARWDDIKKRMVASGRQDLADKMLDRKDEKQNAIAWTWEINEQKKKAAATLGREPTSAELYMYWILPGKADTILKNPNAKIADVLGDNAEKIIKGNPKVFGDGTKSVAETLADLNGRMKAGSEYHFQTKPVQSIPDTRLTSNNWDDNATRFKYKWSDFKNNGEYGGDGYVSARVVQGLDQLSQFMGRKITVSSAYRSESYNASQPGTASHSQHSHGNAIDIDIKNPDEQRQAIKFLASIGITGVGVYDSHMHFDIGNDRSWSKRSDISVDEIKKLKTDGIDAGKSGGYVRMNGFNGAPIDPYEARIQSARKYGIDPVFARPMLMQDEVSRALDMAHTDPVAAQTNLANLYSGFNSISEAERDTVRKAQSQVNEIQRTAYMQKLQTEQIEADAVKEKWLKKAEEDDRAGRPVTPPNRADYPTTAAGRKAYAEASELGLNITPITKEASENNMQLAASRLSDPKLYKELGFGEGTDGERPKSHTEMYTALIKSGKYNLSDANRLANAYMKERTSGPIADQMAAESIKQVRTQHAINNLFRDQKEALVVLSNDFSGNKEGFEAKVREYTDRLVPFYQQTYSELAREAMKHQPNGAPLSYEQSQAIEKSAIEHTRAFAVSMGNTIVATQPIRKGADGKTVTMTGPDGKPMSAGQAEVERISRINQLGDPQQVLMNALQEAQRNGGYVNSDVPGIPKGAMFMLDANGKPMTNGDAYQMRLPNGSVYYMRPADFYLTKDQMNYGTETYGAFDTMGKGTQPPVRPINKPGEMPQRPDTSNMTPAEAAPVKRKYEQDVQTAKQADEKAKLDAIILPRIEKSVNDQFSNDVSNYVREVIYDEFKGELKGKASKDMPAKVEARYKQLTEHYTKELRPYYDAFVQARTALDAATPDQRKQLKDAYQRALSSWNTVSHMASK